MSKSEKPNIFSYSNYREYLKDGFNHLQQENRNYTRRHYAQEAGLKSHSFLKEVIDGKRNLTRASMEKVIKPFRLKHNQTEYFYNLVLFNQADDKDGQNSHYREMIKYHRLSQAKTLTPAQYVYYSDWFNSVVRAAVTLKGFSNDPQWLAQQIIPGITPAQAKRAIRLLLKLGLLKRESDGKLVQDVSRLEIDPDVSTLSIRNFNRNMIDLGKESIERFKPEDREVSGLTIGVSRAGYDHIKEMVRKFKTEVADYVNSEKDAVEVVCQLNSQLFPVTRLENDAVPHVPEA